MALTFDITTMAVEAPARFADLVSVVEDSGCEHLWVCDSSLHARDVFVYLGIVARESQRLLFGPNCTHPYTRHPAINYNAMATLHEISGGRAKITVGAGDRPVMELGYRIAPVARVREMIGAMRALESGDKASFAGKAVQLNDAQLAVDLPARMPLYMAASGPRMLHLAGELCDGVLFLCGTHPACIAFALEQIRAGAERGGRTIEDLDVGWTIYGSLRDDVDLAREECKSLAAWFPQTARHYAELAGVSPQTIENIRAAYSGGHFDAAGEAFSYVTTKMVDDFTIAGPAEVWIERLQQIANLGVTRVNIFLLRKEKVEMAERLSNEVFPALRKM
ncbi:MAG: LLM class flavin-dependent oxidoreductase [Pseudomonadota bacterium]|nr:LLM class flavin-dependent oxidoreductase [Pseudomonadota bacterium]